VLAALKEHLGFEGGETEIVMLVLQTARADERILQHFNTNDRPVYPGGRWIRLLTGA